MSHFKATKKGIMAYFGLEERVFLGDVLPLLMGVGTTEEDPAAARLNVPVYLDDPDSNAEWWRLMGPDLQEARRSDRRIFDKVVNGGPRIMLNDAEADAFLRVLNEARLILGARFGIEVEEDHDRVPEESRQILDYLGWVQEELTTELSKAF